MQYPLPLLLLLCILILPLSADTGEEDLGRESTSPGAGDDPAGEPETRSPGPDPFLRAETAFQMGLREAAAYLLAGDPEDREAFYDRITLSQEAVTRITDSLPDTGNQSTVTAATTARTMRAYQSLVPAATRLFTARDLNGSADNASVSAFYRSSDDLLRAIHTLRISCQETAEGSGTGDPEAILIAGILAGVQDGYAYPVLNDTDRRDAYLTALNKSEEDILMFTREHPQESAGELFRVAEQIQEAATEMVTTYEKEGEILPQSVENLEFLASKLDGRFLYLTA